MITVIGTFVRLSGISYTYLIVTPKGRKCCYRQYGDHVPVPMIAECCNLLNGFLYKYVYVILHWQQCCRNVFFVRH